MATRQARRPETWTTTVSRGNMRTNRIAELVGTALLAAMYIVFAWVHYLAFKATHRPSLVFVVVTETLFAGAIFVRRSANSVSFAPTAWMTALGGTLAPLLLRPVAGVDDQLLGTAIQVMGTVMAVAG